MKYEFNITKTTSPKEKPNPDTLEFGTLFTDHMFVMNYTEGKGWHDGRIVPYGPVTLEPAAAVFHYAQEMFEGLKAYKSKEGDILLFRPDKNAERTNRTNERMCIPLIDEELYVEAIKALVHVDSDWIPQKEGTSLYIRPFIIASEPFLGVRASREYLFMIILSPVGPYYKGGLAPTKIFVEDEYVRATPGGTGFAKIGGNYAAGLKSQEKAHDKGYSQVLWLDGAERKYVEEIGTSNAFFVIDNEIITAPLEGTILPGITRDSVIQLLKSWGMKVSERRITIEDVFKAYEEGKLSEVFASGTAAVISPVGELCWKDRKITIHDNQIGTLSQKIYDTLSGIQLGKLEDPFGWTVKV
ncbi:branched-chain amino acid aminotransferase [Sinanaerobacter chloroacetimidivorans]|jgi:branched-chain amino acid aminotransferase|uniref:Branched-chain-amino-acid aminotransferase n=1 Tax=Sinanaerobacter chloroacetimidivorans TaxID=2818044 RepID=A0A8J8B1D8_9FIRM|nr:branched-chain amino acid aminotransferase [Sinanaerobacter chloroacetimidivorans]MBR0597622.1 branched-chain amino acid aminotransferase [Sinanaerobacter chloroacetimidivorans]